ncbi:GTPase activating protein-like protein GYP1 [Clohesyomyces aquaticus]|uniref:GTPase activating protein-like protein GYP1 n=1 Tax=Clohesyomyces aquaticus TaxID=1231657 RepID=A0A1Y2A0G8_9PLEO|nr:GTPase activating protein-like protein GYP1 [Clohesyomyces aquaticus]
MTSKKQQQEMVQVDRSSSASPFWRTTSNTAKPYESKKVIGASYSHADILNIGSLSVSGSNSRPRTPPSVGHSRDSSAAPGRAGSLTSPPPRASYTSFLRETNHDWDDNEDEGADIMFDDDEDEFGLPSIASMRRKDRRKAPTKGKDPGGTASRNSLGSMAWRSIDAGDIAEERGIPNYPTAKKLEGKILRPQYQEILRDPANSLHLISHASLPPDSSAKDIEAHSSRISRINKFKRILQASTISLPELRNSAWSGIPSEVRAMTWQILLGYLPTSSERRVATLERKRKEYLEGVRQAFERGTSASAGAVASGAAGASYVPATNRGRGRGLDEAIWHQISIDVPRTNPHLELYSYEATQRSLERILYVWAIRHPASGYVQGINDLVSPFWQVFLGAYISDPDIEFGMDPGQLPKQVLDAVEADSFWCLTKLLDGIQDNYISQQPGIQRQVASLRDLTTRIDANLAKHLQNEGVEFIQFSFRWMNCLLMREISVKNTIRMWDTYLAEDDGFSSFHLYVCAAFLVKWSDQLQKMDFQEIMMFLQALPTRQWTEKDIELLLSEAFIWQSLFRGSSAHLKNTGSKDGGFGVGMGPNS